MSNKKLVLISASGVAVAVLGYWIGSPYLAIAEIKSGIQDRDAEKIIKHVDFPAVREDAKAQLIAMMSRKLQNDPELTSNPFAAVASAFVIPMVNGMIDTYVTPSAVKGFLSAAPSVPGQQPEANSAVGNLQKQGSEIKDNFSNASMNYDGLNKFIVTSKNPDGKEYKYKFDRFGFADWKLVSVGLPPS